MATQHPSAPGLPTDRGPRTGAAPPGPFGRAAAAGCALLGLLAVAPLPAWAYGLGSFAAWFWAVTVPSLALLAAVGLATARSARYRRLHTSLVVGTVGGLLGTLAYDVFRVPFLLTGYRLFAPIDSYGVLILDAGSSNAWTGLAGWVFHFGNGIGFGVCYAIVARGRPWYWALVWGLAIESIVVATPVAGVYALRGPLLLAIAYGGHLAYGVPLGLLVSDPERTADALRLISPRTTAYTLLALAAALLLWQRPFAPSAPVRAGEQVAPGPSAIVLDGRFEPQWLRVAPGGCVALRNDDAVAHTLTGTRTEPAPRLEPGVTAQVCFGDPGILRVRTGDVPYSGGFVIVDGAE
ncbi:hypothetical protein AB0F25_25555 [Streptomyces wedmorensis]|uniref:cupredoxin domain-containing protein n=1 Tax=Streptomyces wedmorensis TaxID=43759 RepID=UPI00341258DF